jgi:DNA-damage-inducible protein J
MINCNWSVDAMNKSTTYTFRVNPEIKQEASELFESMGITMADAINLFLHQAVREGAIPFELKRVDVKKEQK